MIREDELGCGILDLQNRGLIPKDADVTPAINRGGNPVGAFKTTTDLIEQAAYFDEPAKEPERQGDSVFLTAKPNPKITASVLSSNMNRFDMTDLLDNQLPPLKKLAKKEIKLSKKAVNPKKTKVSLLKSGQIEVKNLKIVKNSEFNAFKRLNAKKWDLITHIFAFLLRSLKKLGLKDTFIDTQKIIFLSSYENRNLSNKDIIDCLADTEILKHQLTNPMQVFNKLKSASVLMLQRVYRVFKAKKKLEEYNKKNQIVKKLQNLFRIRKLLRNSKKFVKEDIDAMYKQWTASQQKFRDNWHTYKEGERVEIHINSLSRPAGINATVTKFELKENIQLNRLHRLIDPNLTMIMVVNKELSEELVSFYFSVLATLGIEDAESRVHFVVPELAGDLPNSFSLSKLLYLSSFALKKIKHLSKNKKSYIIPGIPSEVDFRVSSIVDAPIIQADPFLIQELFNKSSAKRIFEVNEMAVPIGVWSVFTEEDLISNLTSLIVNYPRVNIWIIKLNKEFNGSICN